MLAATNIPFVIDLEQTTRIELGSLREFQQSVQAFPGFTGTNPTKKAILILQKYITSLSNFGSVSDERQAFFSSNQFLETFTTQLNKLNSSIAPLTFEQFQSESKDESKSAISIFLDTIFLKSYDKQSHSWRTALAKYLKSSGTLCTTLQPISVVRVANTDSPNPAELSYYQSALQPAVGAVARQNAVPSQLINYSFSGDAIGFTKQDICYLCGLPIGAKTANTSTKKKNKDESRALNGVGNTNCEHVMPFLSALQSWDFISKATNPPSIKKKFEMSDEFAWSHFCCNMLKQNIDFLHLDNNGLYVPHYHNIETYLNWLSSNDNRGKYDCLHVLGGFNRDNARTSITERVDRLCAVLNSGNGGAPNKKNNYSDAQLVKVYGIFLLLQYVTVADFSNIIKTKTRIGIGFFGGFSRRRLHKVKDIRDPPVKTDFKLSGDARNARLKKGRLLPKQQSKYSSSLLSSTAAYMQEEEHSQTADMQEKESNEYYSPLQSQTAINYAAAPPLPQPPPYPTPPPSTQPPLLSQAEYLKLFEIIKSAFYQTINGLDEASINWITSIIERSFIDRAAANIETGINLLDYGAFKTTVFTYIWDQVARIGIMEQIITVANAMDGRNIRTIPLPDGITIAGMCETWLSNMIYDYFNIKLTITDKQQILTKLQEEHSIATTDEARSAITQAGQKIGTEIYNLTLMISPTLRKDGQQTTVTNALTTLQAMIKNANEVIFIPMLTSLTTNMTPVVTNISVIENIDDIIFYLEQFLVTSKYYTEAKTAAAALATELANPSLGLGSIPDYVIAQMRTITDLPQGVDPVAANIAAIIATNTPQLSTTINTEWATFYATLAALSEDKKREQMEAIQTKMEEIEGLQQNRDALIKLNEILVGRENLQNLLTYLTNFASGATIDIKSLLILPLKLVQTYLTDSFTTTLKTVVDAVLPQGGGKRNHKRKSGGYRKTIRRNNKRIIRVAKGGGVTYRKKHNKSRKHKTIKHKTRKHKTRKHKRL